MKESKNKLGQLIWGRIYLFGLVMLTYFSVIWNRKELLLLILAQTQSEKVSCSPSLVIAHESLGAGRHQLKSLTCHLINSFSHLVCMYATFD